MSRAGIVGAERHDADIVFTPEARAAAAPEEERAKTRGEGRALDERWHLRKDGSRFWGPWLLMRLTDGSWLPEDFSRRRALTSMFIFVAQRRDAHALFRA